MTAGIPPNRRISVQQRLKRIYRPAWLGTLRTTKPLSDDWGFDRGTAVDRYYIEGFLEHNRQDIHGHVLEVKDRCYTERFGIAVEASDILDIDANNPRANVVADLSQAHSIPSNAYDCFILTQTLQLIYDVRAAIFHAHRILRPGGVLLLTVPSVSRIVHDYGLRTDYWRFTVASCQRLFEEAFGTQVTCRSCGNVLASIAFLTGLAFQELSVHELEAHDDYFPLIITVRAFKSPDSLQASSPS
jgi:SAM-dependent methyltransferase